MKVLVLLYLLLVCSVHADLKKISLLDYVEKVSIANQINIYVDEDLEVDKISFYMPVLKNSFSLMDAFNISLKKKNLKLVFKKEFYYLTKIKIEKSLRVITLNNNSYKYLEFYLKQMQIKHSWLEHINTIVFTSDEDTYIDILNIKSLVDKADKQMTVKFIIFETNKSDIDEIGTKYQSIYETATNNVQIALDTIIVPFSSNRPILKSVDFFAALRLLQTRDDVEIKQFPYVLAKNNQDFIFEAVNNIPYLESTNTVDSANTSTQVSYQYKDVGMKIRGKLSIFDRYADLKLNLTIEDLIKSTTDVNGNQLPITTKRYLESNTQLKYGEVLVLSGINQSKEDKHQVFIPFLSNIPYLGEIFKYKYTTEDNKLLTIAVQIVQSEAPLLSNDIWSEQK